MGLELKSEQLLDFVDKINEIHTKVIVIQNDLDYVRKDVSKNTLDLEEHIAGVRACEARIEQSECQVLTLNKRLELIEEAPKRVVRTLLRIGAALATLIGALVGVWELVKYTFTR